MNMQQASNPSWNEIQFVSWAEFRQMAPSILQLEVTRIGKIIQTFQENTEFHNGLVRARFALEQFVANVKQAEKNNFEETCVVHLRTAIANFPLQPDDLDAETKKTCRYILDRLNYVYHRITLIY